MRDPRSAPRPARRPAVVLLLVAFLVGCASAVPAGGSADAPPVAGTASTSPEAPARPRPVPRATTGAPDGPAAGHAADGHAPDDGPDLSAHSPDDPASPWVVVNKARPIDRGYVPELTDIRGHLLHPAAAADLTALLAAAEADGVHLTIRSAYRSADYQARVHDGWVAQLGRERAEQVSARPGHSEHQTGLAVDLGSTTRPECDFSDCFDDTVEGRWLVEHATASGFLIRYTAANREVTGFAPEGWHLRHVGRDLAAHLASAGVDTLEELFGVPGGERYP